MKDRSLHPLVSVVTPFLNTDRYLGECIESVLRQSYQNWEYVLVDNCSTDRSPEIAARYAAKDARIRLYSNESFLTQTQNYNRALSLLSPGSMYCKIVQADDWIFPGCLAEMVRVAELNSSVAIVGAYRLDDTKVNCDGLPYQATIMPGREIGRASLLGRYFVFGSATSILIRSDIVRSRVPFFSESSYHEDTEACYEILRDHDFGFVHQVLTFTRRENESISSRVRRCDPFHLLDQLIALQRYGPIFLEEREYRTALQRTENRYFRFIARGLFGTEAKELLSYHRVGLTRAGYNLSRSKLSKHLFFELIALFFDLKRAGHMAGRLPSRILRVFR